MKLDPFARIVDAVFALNDGWSVDESPRRLSACRWLNADMQIELEVAVDDHTFFLHARSRYITEAKIHTVSTSLRNRETRRAIDAINAVLDAVEREWVA